jgi:protein-tyrosine phosphatase
MTQIFEELYLGSELDALSEKFMNQKPTVTVNMASEANESKSHVMYLEVPLNDERIDLHFKTVNEFIDTNLEKGYRVLVYSKYGIARSASFVVAYLMYKRVLPFMEVYEYVKQKGQ